MGAAGRAVAAEKFDLRKNVGDLLCLYAIPKAAVAVQKSA